MSRVRALLTALRLTPKTSAIQEPFVRPSTRYGAPVEIYCFSTDTQWLGYEAFQSRLLDHLFAILPEFGLRAFQELSGPDLVRAEGSLSPERGEAVPDPAASDPL